MSNFVFMNRSRILATTARRQTIGAMNAVKPLNNWSAIAASGASGNGGNVNGASMSAANTVAMSMAAATIVTGIATETATDALHSFVVLRWGRKLARIHQLFLGKDSFESPRLVLIVQHHDRHHAQPLFAGMALRHFALQ